MLYQIIINVPLWVWPLFIGLLAIGLLGTRSRQAPLILFWFLPLLGALAVNSMAAFGATVLAWAVFAVFYIAGCLFGFNYQKKIVLERKGSRVSLKGEWLTLVTIMIIFWTNFARGLMTAIFPDIIANPATIAIIAAIVGSVSGVFLGRSIQTLFGKVPE